MQQLSNTKKEKFKLSNKLQEKVFNIRLQTSNQVQYILIFISFFRK